MTLILLIDRTQRSVRVTVFQDICDSARREIDRALAGTIMVDVILLNGNICHFQAQIQSFGTSLLRNMKANAMPARMIDDTP